LRSTLPTQFRRKTNASTSNGGATLRHDEGYSPNE
jgi:hypothetical protein